MILECDGCHHVYDVSAYEQGQRLRCRCGQVLVVPGEAHVSRPVRVLHCSNCGGQLERGAARCPYCDSLVDLTSARLNAYCHSCLSVSPENARFCCGCGGSLLELLESPVKASQVCPRCRVAMRSRFLAGHEPLECPMCCGLFVAGEDFADLIEEQAARTSEIEDTMGPEKARLGPEKISYLPCPFCGHHMNRVNYDKRSGVIIDYCLEHGYWFDAGELEKVARWVATGGEIRKYAVDDEDKRRGRIRFTRPTPVPARDQEPDEPRAAKRRADKEEVLRRFEDASFLEILLMCLLGE